MQRKITFPSVDKTALRAGFIMELRVHPVLRLLADWEK
jgi:hypothetical protein